MKKLIRQLQWAHASKIAAYHAYRDHWESLHDDEEIEEVQRIQNDEREHINLLKIHLRSLGASSDPNLDKIYTHIGKAIGALCKVTGRYMPMYIVMLMKKLSTRGYKDIAITAYEAYEYDMYQDLIVMSRVELEHKIYFKNKLKKRY